MLSLPLDCYANRMDKLFAGLIALTCFVGCQRPAATPKAVPPVRTGTVTMKIVIDGKTEVIEFAEIAEGTTLEALMKKMDDPPVVVKMRGSKTTAFVESIGEKETSASEGWTFQVDGKFSTQGVGTTILSPPTTVTWKFGDFSDQQLP